MTNEPFNFWNDRKAYSLQDLILCLSEISNDEFSNYVDVSKNDFANWIKGSLQESELAEKIRRLSDKDAIKAEVSAFLSSENDKLLLGTKKSVQEDSLVMEVMKKNDEFLKYDSNQNKANDQSAVADSGLNPKDRWHIDNEKIALEEVVGKDTEKEQGNEGRMKIENVPETAAVKTGRASDLSLLDIPNLKKRISNDLFIGVLFGLVAGSLITLIVLQLLTL